MDSGKVHKACMCDNEALINEFNTTVNKLFELHPELEKLDIVRLKTKDGTSLAQSLSGIKHRRIQYLIVLSASVIIKFSKVDGLSLNLVIL
jgi:hypothetical protein